MITSTELRNKLDDVMDMLTSNYTPTQWKAKKEIDVARHKEAKRVYKEAKDAISFEDIDWDDDTFYEDYEAISQLIGRLGREIEKMEEDLNIC